MECLKQLLEPSSFLHSRKDVLASPSIVPSKGGLYAWYFREIPPHVPIEKCHKFKNYTLLYVGISPKSPSSKQTLFNRIRSHYRGKAYGSTLRLTLGCLLSEKLKIQLRRIGSGDKFKFDNEKALSEWMEQNAFVVWVEDKEPWLLEKKIITDPSIGLPLNLDMNRNHPFHETLSKIRSNAKESAKKLPAIGQ